MEQVLRGFRESTSVGMLCEIQQYRAGEPIDGPALPIVLSSKFRTRPHVDPYQWAASVQLGHDFGRDVAGSVARLMLRESNQQVGQLTVRGVLRWRCGWAKEVSVKIQPNLNSRTPE